jgi:hypothetical protein
MFYCDNCRAWTESDEEVRCARCGDNFTCGDCGFEIDSQGNCQRELATGDKCPSTKEKP